MPICLAELCIVLSDPVDHDVNLIGIMEDCSAENLVLLQKKSDSEDRRRKQEVNNKVISFVGRTRGFVNVSQGPSL